MIARHRRCRDGERTETGAFMLGRAAVPGMRAGVVRHVHASHSHGGHVVRHGRGRRRVGGADNQAARTRHEARRNQGATEERQQQQRCQCGVLRPLDGGAGFHATQLNGAEDRTPSSIGSCRTRHRLSQVSSLLREWPQVASRRRIASKRRLALSTVWPWRASAATTGNASKQSVPCGSSRVSSNKGCGIEVEAPADDIDPFQRPAFAATSAP